MSLMRLLGTLSGVALAAVGTADVRADTVYGCYHEPGDVWFYGKHLTTLASGVVLDARPDESVPTGHKGQVFLITVVQVLGVVPTDAADHVVVVGQKVRVLQKLECANCDASRTEQRGYSRTGEKRWFSASVAQGDPFESLVGRVLPFDLELDSFCDASLDRQKEGSANPLGTQQEGWRERQ